MKKIISLWILIFSFSAFAEEQSKVGEIIDESIKTATGLVEKVSKPVKNVLNTSPQIRQRNNMAIFIQYAPIDLILPGKTGASIYYSGADRNVQYELQYLKGSFGIPFIVEDLGELSDQRISFLKRKFSGEGNFNWYYGLSYHILEAHLGNRYLSSISALDQQQVNEIDILKIHSLGFDLGVGHRWYFNNNITLSVDWVGWSQPVFILKKQNYYAENAANQNDRDNTKKFMDIAAYLPRMSFLKLSAGYSF